MKKLLILFIFILMMSSSSLFAGEPPTGCAAMPVLLKQACLRLRQIWLEGDNDGYLTLYAWHNRYTYTREKLATTIYNERAWGGGFGKSLYDEKGNLQWLYGIAFLDSHNHVQPIIGYGWQKIAHINDNFRLGLGFSALITMRSDIFGGYPFPGAAPAASICYRNLTFMAAYVPGGTNIGNVLFVIAKWRF